MERPTDLSLEAIHARVEADRPALEARIEEARVHEIPEIRARIEADRPALDARIQYAREYELPEIRRRIDADRPALEARIATSWAARQKRWREQG